MSQVTLGGNAIPVDGAFPAKGDAAKPFTLVGKDLADVSLASFAGKNKVLNIFPSIDTPTCATSVRRFNEAASKLENTVVLCISPICRLRKRVSVAPKAWPMWLRCRPCAAVNSLTIMAWPLRVVRSRAWQHVLWSWSMPTTRCCIPSWCPKSRTSRTTIPLWPRSSNSSTLRKINDAPPATGRVVLFVLPRPRPPGQVRQDFETRLIRQFSRLRTISTPLGIRPAITYSEGHTVQRSTLSYLIVPFACAVLSACGGGDERIGKHVELPDSGPTPVAQTAVLGDMTIGDAEIYADIPYNNIFTTPDSTTTLTNTQKLHTEMRRHNGLGPLVWTSPISLGTKVVSAPEIVLRMGAERMDYRLLNPTAYASLQHILWEYTDGSAQMGMSTAGYETPNWRTAFAGKTGTVAYVARPTRWSLMTAATAPRRRTPICTRSTPAMSAPFTTTPPTP